MKITVTQGEIWVNCVELLFQSENAILIEIDCRAKYVEANCDSLSLFLSRGESTLYAEEDTEDFTEIKLFIDGFYPEDDDNVVLVSTVECGRYSIRWSIIKAIKEDRKELYP